MRDYFKTSVIIATCGYISFQLNHIHALPRKIITFKAKIGHCIHETKVFVQCYTCNTPKSLAV